MFNRYDESDQHTCHILENSAAQFEVILRLCMCHHIGHLC